MNDSQSDEKDSTKDKGGIHHKIKYVLSILTIEPMMIVQGIATNISIVPSDQMVLYKICRGDRIVLIKIFLEKAYFQSLNLIWLKSFVLKLKLIETQQSMMLLKLRLSVSMQSNLGRSILFQFFSRSTLAVGVIILVGNLSWLSVCLEN